MFCTKKHIIVPDTVTETRGHIYRRMDYPEFRMSVKEPDIKNNQRRLI